MTASTSVPGRGEQPARAITNLLKPVHVLLAGLTGIGLAAGGSWAGALWGLFAALCAGLLPAGYIDWEKRRGRWGDRHVVDRASRRPIFLVILGSIGFAAAVMVLAGAPGDVLRAMVALWVMTVGLLVVNDAGKWKISVDCAVASSVVTMLTVVAGPWWSAAYCLTLLVCWTRVHLGYHTTAQTAAGTALGMATTLLWLV
ncbi:hypothetical protein [Streptomyces sp. CA-111067]|uniref:hypothetical protein n=1 Tax=Streptomyces sp. CA-111067 TaxID=3240046 RepID=UPI003D97681D